MQAKSIFTAAMTALILSGGAASAQQDRNQPAAGNQPAAKQSAPAESPDASGHDAQAGKPETGPNARQTQGAASDDYKDAQDNDKK
ncbi:MAG: hypothetical protein M9932_12040 [Xanthobacteraceae bacterium]|nr:hypothetical protein [Xanthobacteraceae bacterium]